jgi:hypothetical protein
MSAGAPQHHVERRGKDVWVAYRTRADDHFAVIRFTQVYDVVHWDSNDETLDTHPLYSAGLAFYAFHEVVDPLLAGSGLRRWIITFHDYTLDITARGVTLVIRAFQAPSAEHALAALNA